MENTTVSLVAGPLKGAFPAEEHRFRCCVALSDDVVFSNDGKTMDVAAPASSE
ncbi:MAG TPA: hypothetical protein VF460_05920 [Burkholderiales bacterium]